MKLLLTEENMACPTETPTVPPMVLGLPKLITVSSRAMNDDAIPDETERRGTSGHVLDRHSSLETDQGRLELRRASTK